MKPTAIAVDDVTYVNVGATRNRVIAIEVDATERLPLLTEGLHIDHHPAVVLSFVTRTGAAARELYASMSGETAIALSEALADLGAAVMVREVAAEAVTKALRHVERELDRAGARTVTTVEKVTA